MRKIIFLLTVCFLATSCTEKEIDFANLVERNGKTYEVNSEKPFSGKVFKKDEKGQFALTGFYTDGLKDKEWIEYYENGQKSKISNFSKNALNGIQEKYTREGQLVRKLSFKDGKKNGEFEYFYENGNKKSKGKYLNDNYSGLIEEWYDDSKYKMKGKFIDGKYDGLIEKWYPNGKPKSAISYTKNTLNGNSKEYNSSGFIERDFNYKNGEKDGLCIVYYSKDKKKTSINYTNDKKNGLYEEWYSNNNKYKEITYKDNLVQSEKYWNEDGTIRPLLKDGLIGKWDGTYSDGHNLWIEYLTFKNNNKLNIEQDRQPADGNGKNYGYYYNYDSNYNIKSFNEFSLSRKKYGYRDWEVHNLKIIYLSKTKMIVNIKMLNGKWKEYRKK